MNRISPYALGATLYMPATRIDIADVVLNGKIPGLRSLVVCLEDAVGTDDVQAALANLQVLLETIEAHGGRPVDGPLLFVRPRDVDMARQLNAWPSMKHVDGFVVPKLSLQSLASWEKAVSKEELLLMPTLETPEVFDPGAMVTMAKRLRYGLGERIIALRIGGNDLMGCLGLRRIATRTLYETPMGYVISMLSGVMGSNGFSLTAPVFEQLATPDILQNELELDIAHGMVGKTAIHPSQIETIQDAFKVSLADLNAARLIVSDSAPAVFKHDGAMCEPATHRKWALNILERAKWHGVKTFESASPAEGQIRLAGAAV